MLYTDFESNLKPFDEQYAEREGKTPYTKKINTYVPSGCVFGSRLLMEVFLIH